ncbi:MAG: UDP-N-acetylmuramate:L-alanyl-gamma-D-glutamyl-meso-diaminopimelate ligase [Deltaproteobacteria bacterium]|nr:UDP-N-acetylmuramate:L-alanyl-gamma-D-glutamyl-meso-diaminopimelate ligase [Deltaproteobacteria bacterium]
MASVAGLFQSAGFRVTGSDAKCYPPMSTMLAEMAIPILEGFDAAHLAPRPDLVIIGNVCTAANPEARAAIDGGIPYRSMPHAVAEYLCHDRFPIMAVGTHGKTTTSSLLAWILESAGRSPSFLIGGIPKNFGRNFQLGRGREFVIEGDEYDTAFFEKTPKFLHYPARAVILGPVEFDHADIYADLDAVLSAFRTLIRQLPTDALLIAAADSAHVESLMAEARCPCIPFRLSDATQIVIGAMGTTFTWHGTSYHSPLAGHHNLQNTIGVITLLEALGLSPAAMMHGLAAFAGVRRRQEILGEIGGVTVIDDFAHHPTAIRETLAALRHKFPGQRLLVAFEPRSNTSGREIFRAEYRTAFRDATRVVFAPVFKADRIPPSEQLHLPQLIGDLQREGTAAAVHDTPAAICDDLLAHVRSGDVIVVMSNGDFGGLHGQLLARLRKPSSCHHG